LRIRLRKSSKKISISNMTFETAMRGRTNHLELYLKRSVSDRPRGEEWTDDVRAKCRRTILSIAQRVDRLDVDVVTTELSSILGATVVAVLGHATETRSVRALATARSF